MLPISFPSWLVWRPGWNWNTWWTLELCLCDNHTLCESLSMQIDPNNVNNVKVPTFTEEAGKKADLNWTLSEGSLSFEWEIMTEREDRWEYPDLKSNWLWWLLCDMTIDMKNWCTMQDYDLFRDNKEKRNDSLNMGKHQALLPTLGKAQEFKRSPNFAVRVGTSPAISSCPHPIVYLWPIHQRGSLRFSVMNSPLPTLLSLSFRHVTAHTFNSMYPLGSSTVLLRGRIWPQRAGQMSQTANCSSLKI